MLFDFHHKQNSKKAGTLHATYVITGRQQQRQASQTNGLHSQESEDVHMQSSPFPGSSAPQHREQEELEPTWIRLVTLAKEQDLEAAKTQLDEVDSVHIYSLSPGAVNDLQILTDCNRRVASEYAQEDPLELGKQYGTVQNPNVKRRTGRRAPPPIAAPVQSTKPAAKPATEPKAQLNPTAQAKESPALSKPAAKETTEKTNSKAAPEQDSTASSRRSSNSKAPNLKRDASSIFKSFAKAKPKAKKESATEGSHTHSNVRHRY